MLPAKPIITIRKLKTKTSIISLEGDLTASAEYPLLQAYREASQGNVAQIILDLHSLDYMNSYGIAILIKLLTEATSHKQRLIGYGLNEHYLRILGLSRLSEFIRLYPDERAALAAANAGAHSN